MKKVIIILIILIFIFVLFSKEEELRIRVIANSNSEYDQRIKYEVVSILKNIINANDTRKDIESKINEIKKQINSYLSKLNIEFTIGIKEVEYEAKELNGSIIPSGVYETLLVVIGKGEGKNWWSLLYPEYFDITFEDIKSNEIIPKSFFYEKLFK